MIALARVPDAHRRKIVETDDGCWVWTGFKLRGYGRSSQRSNFPSQIVHRAVYLLEVGPIPEGMTIDHLCRVKACVNPAHMQVVSIAENNRRRDEANSSGTYKTQCRNGHAFDEETTKWVAGHGGRLQRICRICRVQTLRRYSERRNAA